MPFPSWKMVAALASVAVVSLAASGRAPDAPATGRIAGHVMITTKLGATLPSAAYAPRRVERPSGEAVSELANVIVFLQDPPKGPAPAPVRAKIVQENETFVPRVAAVTRGSTVDFPNGDPFFHDVFSLSRSGTFDLGSYPRGQSRSHVFTQTGLVKVYCHIHSHMSASIMVFDHRYFAIPSSDGGFTIDGVPAGSYHVSAWHERIGENTQTVRVEAGATADLKFSLPILTK